MPSPRAARRIALTASLLVLLGGCAGPVAEPPAPAVSSTVSPDGERSELIVIASDRRIYLNCQGQGEPTVFFISGTGGAADEWMVTADPSDPGGTPTLSDRSVFETVSRTTRVCAYDRPGTTLVSELPSSSTAVAQPTTAQDGVDDLALLVAASGEDTAGSFVLVGASWGGLIAQLYARSHPDHVVGLVLVDSASTFLATAFTSEQWEKWMALNAANVTGAAEAPNYVDSMKQLNAAPQIPGLPVTVLSSDRPWDLGVTPGQSTWSGWLAAQGSLATEWAATHVGETGSGHGIHVEQPSVVAASVVASVRKARDGM